MRILEIGPNSQPSAYAQTITSPNICWETLDIRWGSDLTYPGADQYEYPVADATFDIVLAGQVLEHVPRIWVWVKTLARISKPGGFIITINPVSWPYHEAPVDCWRVYPAGMRALYEIADLEVLLSKCESVEAEGLPAQSVIPGRGLDWQSPAERHIRHQGLPQGVLVECAFDTLTIGRKPLVRME